MVTSSEVLLDLRAHVVQFYDSERELSVTVGTHLAAALRSGDAVVVIAARSHREAFAGVLASSGIDVESARRSGQLVEFDSAQTLAKFMVGGTPDAAAFDEAMGAVVRRAAAGGRSVRAYGEMVAHLWEQGLVPAAIELERLWNSLGERLPFSMFCAYPNHLVSGGEFADAFDEVCHLHSAVVDPAVQEPLAEVSGRFPCTLESPREARLLVARTLEEWGHTDLVDDAALAVTELATNSVAHARSDFEVTLTRRPGDVRVAVRDSSRVEPLVRPASVTGNGGRGMRLVAAVGSRWGCDLTASGKQVWVEFVTSGRG